MKKPLRVVKPSSKRSLTMKIAFELGLKQEGSKTMKFELPEEPIDGYTVIAYDVSVSTYGETINKLRAVYYKKASFHEVNKEWPKNELGAPYAHTWVVWSLTYPGQLPERGGNWNELSSYLEHCFATFEEAKQMAIDRLSAEIHYRETTVGYFKEMLKKVEEMKDADEAET